MDQRMLLDLMAEAVRVVVVAGLPVLAACVVAGLLVGVLQSATSIHEPVLGYAAKLMAMGVVLYLMLPGFTAAVYGLAERVFR